MIFSPAFLSLEKARKVPPAALFFTIILNDPPSLDRRSLSESMKKKVSLWIIIIVIYLTFIVICPIEDDEAQYIRAGKAIV